MFKFPTTDGASSVIWSGESGRVRERIRVECKGGDRWLLNSETLERHDNQWGEGGVSLEGYRSMYSGLVIDLRFKANADLMTVDLMTVMAKGKAEIPRTKPVKFARMTGKCGWWTQWTNDGEDQEGTPSLCIDFKRPLSAEEMVCALTKMAFALAAWDKERAGE